MMAFLGTLILGLIVGLLARALTPGNNRMGWIMTIVLGIAGSLVASYAGTALGWYPPGSNAGWIASVVGAIVVLLLYEWLRGKYKR